MSKKPIYEELEKRIEELEQTISERKRSQEALRENTERFWLFTGNASDIMQIAASEGVILYGSPSVQHVLRHKPDEFVDQISTDLVPLDYLPLVPKNFEGAKHAPDRPVVVEPRCKHKDDRWRVINNVVIYAEQAMPKGGVIQVKAAHLLLNDSNTLRLEPDAYTHIAIKGQDVGIAEKYRPIIFAPYVTTKQEGICLGLVTVYSIIQKHHGAITVESTLGAGRTFHIYLPASNSIIPEKNEGGLISGHDRILVMDNEAPLRRMLGRMLKQLDYDAEFAERRAEAIAMYEKAKKSGTPCDTVILDLVV
jgi:signal transduction histidine kinase